MTNQHRAFEAIVAAIDGFTAPEAIPGKALENLYHAGLIAPDLPAPTNTLPDESLVWELTTDRNLNITLSEGKIFLGDKQLHPLVVKELSLNLMAALHAAADYEDEEA